MIKNTSVVDEPTSPSARCKPENDSLPRLHPEASESTMEEEPNEEIALILDDYLRSLDRPVPISLDELLEQHPQYAGQLRLYLSGLELLHESAAGFAGGFDQVAKANDDQTTSRTLGDFELLDEIGRGGMGVVFRAKQGSLNRFVAVKVLPFAAVLDSKQIARFKTEARSAALVHHPNIVPVYAIGQHHGVHFYAMHLVDGGSLADNHDLTIREIAAVGIDAARALHAAHEHGVVHRDIKPSNLLLDKQSKLWITDFGLARIQSDVSLTQTRDVIGSLPYMSPEQACGNNLGVDHRTDIYSLGASLYELLTGRRVIEEDDPADVSRRMDAEPIKPRVLNANIPRDLETVVLKCLEKSKEARYDTASDLANDLQRFLDGIPTLAKPASLMMKSSKWMRRHQRLVALLTSFLSVLVAVLGVSTVLILRESGKKETALYSARLSAMAAQQNYRDARTAVDHFGSQIAEQLVGVPGTESIRDSILTDTLAYYERFVERSGSEPSSRLDTAVTLTKIADLRQRSGQTPEAIAAYRQADELLEQLSLQRHPAGASRMGTLARPIELGQEWPYDDGCSTDLLIQRINCKNNLALLLSRDGKIEEAQTIINELLRIESHHLVETNVLFHVYNNAGLLAEQQGDLQRARQCYESALQLQKPDSSWRDRATTLNNLGMLSRREGQTLQAADQLKNVIELYVTNHRADHPKHATFRHEYAIAESNLASVYSSIDQLRDSLEHYTIAADVLSELSDVSPGSVTVESDLASAINNIGLMQSRLGQHRTAIDSFQRAFEVQQGVTKSQPNVATHASALASISSNLGVAYTSVQRRREARAAFQRAIQFQTKAIGLAPDVERYAMLLTQHRQAWENIHEE